MKNESLDAPWDLQAGFSPSHQYFAYITGFGRASIHPTLIILAPETAQTIFRLELSGSYSQVSPETSPGDPAFEALRATEHPGSLAWSPDGKKLAFVAAIDGGSNS